MKIYKLELKIVRFLETNSYQKILESISKMREQFPNDRVEFSTKDITYEAEHDYPIEGFKAVCGKKPVDDKLIKI